MRSFLRKTISGLTIAATMVWSVGLTAFVPTASAAITSGSLIKASGAAVYYYGADGKRYVFPNEKTYFTWYPDFSGVMTITDAELASISIGGNVTYRPGVKLVKITTDPKVYAVSKGGVLRWVTTGDIAACLYGANWAFTSLYDLPDAFFAGNYTVGTPINACSDYNRAAELAAATSINADKNLTGGVIPPVIGSVTATLATDNPASATIPKAATGITVLKFNLSGSGTVTNLTFKDMGIGAASDVAAVYLYDGATRLTSAKTLNTTTKEVSFNLNWTISGTKTYSLVMDLAAAATTFGQHQFGLTMINAVAVSGVNGNTFTVGAESVSTVTIDKTTTPINPKVGAIAAELANFKITGGVNDAKINRITFTQTGSIDSADLKNFVLKQSGTTVATTATMSGDKIVLVFSTPFSLLSGAVKNFTLYADVAGRPGRTISLYIDETSDVNVTDVKYGYPAAITNNFGAANAVTITTEGGELTVAFNGPVAGDVSKGAQDVNLFEFSLSAVSPMTIRNSYLKIDGTAGSTQDVFTTGSLNAFTDIKIINKATGQVVAGPVSYTVATGANSTGILTLTDDFDISGTTNYAITADIANDIAYAGITYKVTFGNATTIFVGGSDVKYQNSNDFVSATNIVPNTPIVGNGMTVRSASLKVGISSTIGNNTSVKGAADVQAAAFAVTAGSDSAIKITKFIVDPRVDDTSAVSLNDDFNANTIIASAKLWKKTSDGVTTLLAGPKGVVGAINAETITFDNFTDTIAAGNSVVYIVSVTFSTTAAAVNSDYMALTIQTAANITAEDKDNNSVVATNAVGGAITTAAAINDTDGAANNIVVPTVVSTIIAVGTFTISADTADTAYKSRLVQMGTVNNKVLRLKAKGTSEAFKATDIQINATNPGNLVSVTITYPTDAAQTTMETKTGVFVGNVSNLSGLNWFITKDVDSYATIVAEINSDTNGASSVQLGALDATIVKAETDDTDLGASSVTKILGLASGTYVDTTTANADSVGNTVYARKTIITVTKDAASPAGTGFVSGLNEYLRFKVANSNGNTALVDKLTIQVSASDALATNWNCDNLATYAIYDVTDMSTDLLGGTGAANVSCVADVQIATVNFTGTGVSISAGSSRTFALKFDTNAGGTVPASASDDTLRVDIVIPNDTATANTDVQWNDGVNTVNGWKVEQLPVTGGNIQF